MPNHKYEKKKGDPVLSSILGKCPRCHNAKAFNGKAYNLKQITDMKKECSNCKQDFKKEPGFYFGASYVSYGLTIALWVAVGVALITFDYLGWISFSFFENRWTYIFTAIIALIVFLPPIYRISRLLWLSIFIKDTEDNE